MKPLTSLSGLLQGLPPTHGIVMHSGAAHPTVLARLLAEAAEELQRRQVHVLMPCGPIPYAEASIAENLQLTTPMPGSGLRKAMDAGLVTLVHEPLSALARRFEQRAHDVGAVLLRTSPPDSDGRVSLGVSVDYMPEAIAAARFVVAEIDPKMPRTGGHRWLPVQRIDAFVDAIDGPHTVELSESDAVDDAIATNIASLVNDGDTLQLGVGSLPDRVLAKLSSHKHLGLHTGIIGDGAYRLFEQGVLDNSNKEVCRGISVATMALGSAQLYRLLNANRAVEIQPCSITHAADVLARLRRLCAVNSALQVDLDGRVNVEWAGARRVSLPGGLTDFAQAASAHARGRSIIALRSTARNGASNIVSALSRSVPCALGPDDVNYFVTEFGVAAVRELTSERRRRAIATIAHPAHREALQ